ncbi:MAG: sulfotransferase domain-containing protein [Pseudomonadota bacterium]
MQVSLPQMVIDGPLTRTAHWEAIAFHPGDVIVATVPKSGTTWTQALVSAMLSATPGAGYTFDGLSPWADCSLREVAPLAEKLATVPGRRCLKSHAPLEALPWSDELFYVACYRHPLDAHFSMRTHVARMAEHMDLKARFPLDDPAATFEHFLEEDAPENGTDNMTLASIARHFESVRARLDQPNVVLLHYADLKRDPLGEARRLAGALGVALSDEMLSAIVDGAGFEKMRERARANPGETFTATPDFFAEGTSNKWAGHLSDAQLAAYAAKADALMSPQTRAWLENGGTRA